MSEMYVFENEILTEINMPEVRTEVRSITIKDNDELEEINLSGLTTFPGSLNINNNIRLTTITMPSFKQHCVKIFNHRKEQFIDDAISARINDSERLYTH